MLTFPKLFAHILGALFAISALSGRWSLARVLTGSTFLREGSLSSMLILQPRFLCTFAAVLLALLLSRGKSRRVDATGSHRFALLVVLLILFIYLMITGLWCPPVPGEVFIERVADLILIMMLCICSYKMSVADDTGALVRLSLRYLAFVAVVLVISGVPRLLYTDVSDPGATKVVLGGGRNIFARYAGMVLLAILDSTPAHRSIVSLILSTPVLALLLSTGSRGGCLATAVASLSLLGARFRLREMLRYAIAAPVVVIPVIIAFRFVYPVASENLANLVMTRYYQKTYIEGYTSGRSELYAFAIEGISDSPLWGHGLCGWQASGSPFEYPHNVFLEVQYEGGAFASLLFVGALAMTVYNCVRLLGRRQLSHYIASLCVLYFVAAQFSGDLYDTRLLFGLLLLCSTPFVPAPVEAAGRKPGEVSSKDPVGDAGGHHARDEVGVGAIGNQQ